MHHVKGARCYPYSRGTSYMHTLSLVLSTPSALQQHPFILCRTLQIQMLNVIPSLFYGVF